MTTYYYKIDFSGQLVAAIDADDERQAQEIAASSHVSLFKDGCPPPIVTWTFRRDDPVLVGAKPE